MYATPQHFRSFLPVHDLILWPSGSRPQVTIPPVENIKCRSAMCCYYFGFACMPEDKPLGVTGEKTMLCYQSQGGCQVLTTAVKKRACCSCVTMQQCCSCEVPGQTEFIMYETSCRGLLLCIIEQGVADKCSCCPQPLTLFGSQGQCCCVFTRCNFPCNDLTPCELGCCGIFCINKVEIIKEAEAKIRDRQSGSAVEAVIVEKGGAPVEVMER